MAAPITFPSPALSLRERLWRREGQKCHWCKQPTRLNPLTPQGTLDGNAWDMATKDHILPRYKGGGSAEDNLVSACRLCNNRRSHEDNCGLPDGSLLGKFDPSRGMKPKKLPGIKRVSRPMNRVCLTADDKKQILAGKPLPARVVLPQVEPRPVYQHPAFELAKAMKEISILRTENEVLKAQVGNYRHRLDTMTFKRLALIKLLRWLGKK